MPLGLLLASRSVASGDRALSPGLWPALLPSGCRQLPAPLGPASLCTEDKPAPGFPIRRGVKCFSAFLAFRLAGVGTGGQRTRLLSVCLHRGGQSFTVDGVGAFGDRFCLSLMVGSFWSIDSLAPRSPRPGGCPSISSALGDTQRWWVSALCLEDPLLWAGGLSAHWLPGRSLHGCFLGTWEDRNSLTHPYHSPPLLCRGSGALRLFALTAASALRLLGGGGPV